jgi:hypothetical protein
MLDRVEEAKGSIGLMTGRFNKEQLLSLSKLLPLQIMPFIPEVEKALLNR